MVESEKGPIVKATKAIEAAGEAGERGSFLRRFDFTPGETPMQRVSEGRAARKDEYGLIVTGRIDERGQVVTPIVPRAVAAE